MTSSTVSVAPIPADVPDVLLAPCPAVTDLPPRAIGSDEVARLWARDRANLGDCGARHGALATAARALEAQRGGTSR